MLLHLSLPDHAGRSTCIDGTGVTHALNVVTGNREGKVLVWEAQSSPPNLIARWDHLPLILKLSQNSRIQTFSHHCCYWYSLGWPQRLSELVRISAGYLTPSASLQFDRLPYHMMEGWYKDLFTIQDTCGAGILHQCWMIDTGRCLLNNLFTIFIMIMPWSH